jgi:hypothetical protein
LEAEKRIEILGYLKATTEITIADLAEFVGLTPKETYKKVIALIGDGWCTGHVEGPWCTGKFVAKPLAHVPIPYEMFFDGSPYLPKSINVGDHSTLIMDSPLKARGDIAIAKDVLRKDTFQSKVEVIKPVEVKLPLVFLKALETLSTAYKKAECERGEMLDNLDTLEKNRNSLRRKLGKTTEENEQLTALSNQISGLSQKLDNHDERMVTQLTQLRSQFSDAASKIVDDIIIELEKQDALLAESIVSENKELFQLIESTSMALNAKLEIQKEDIEKIFNQLEISDEHLKNIFTVIDEQASDKKFSLEQQIITLLKREIPEVGKDPEEMKNLLKTLFNSQEDIAGRILALKNFFTKTKTWINEHPAVINALRLVLTGVLTYMGVQVQKV